MISSSGFILERGKCIDQLPASISILCLNYKTVDNRIATVECNTRNNFIFKSFHLERNPCKDRGKQPMYKVCSVASKGPVKDESFVTRSFLLHCWANC